MAALLAGEWPAGGDPMRRIASRKRSSLRRARLRPASSTRAPMERAELPTSRCRALQTPPPRQPFWLPLGCWPRVFAALLVGRPPTPQVGECTNSTFWGTGASTATAVEAAAPLARFTLGLAGLTIPMAPGAADHATISLLTRLVTLGPRPSTELIRARARARAGINFAPGGGCLSPRSR